MTTGSTRTRRRTLLQRGLALAAGGAAIGGGARFAAAASPPAAAQPAALTMYARKRPVAAGQDRTVGSGDLLDAPDGQAVGSFQTTCFGVQSPFGSMAAASLEFHVLQLAGGTLFTMGAGGDDSTRALAIVGGTGAFTGRTGACIERSVAARLGEDIRELTVTFAG